MAAIMMLSPVSFAPTIPMVTRPSAMASSPSIMMATDWKKPAMSVFLALALTFSPMDAAEAGRSGGGAGPGPGAAHDQCLHGPHGRWHVRWRHVRWRHDGRRQRHGPVPGPLGG